MIDMKMAERVFKISLRKFFRNKQTNKNKPHQKKKKKTEQKINICNRVNGLK